MQAFYKTHRYLLEHLNVQVRRELMDEINWDDRLIGIKGARGVGKTAFLLNYAKEKFGMEKTCLYVNMNNLFFSGNSIVSFADEFQKKGGKTLILDQVYKYPDWSQELKYCYDFMPDLRIVFSGSSVMRLKDENPDLRDRVSIYTLEGFSFREFLNLKAGTSFKKVTFPELLDHHQSISQSIVEKIKPLAYFNDYLHHGYYPFYLEQNNYLEDLLKTINLTLEIDISYLQQVELKYLPKLRKLLYYIGLSAPFQPNVSKLSHDIETSRATVMNYITYLKQAKLVNLLYESEEDVMKKPSKVFMQNPNLVFSVALNDVDVNVLHKTFFYNQVGYKNQISSSHLGDFQVNGTYHFVAGGRMGDPVKNHPDVYCARDMVEVGDGNQIPLWLFGFLY